VDKTKNFSLIFTPIPFIILPQISNCKLLTGMAMVSVNMALNTEMLKTNKAKFNYTDIGIHSFSYGKYLASTIFVSLMI
jgi:hypothetical protein